MKGNDPVLIPESYCRNERLKEKFDWLLDYRADVELWCSWLALTDAALDLVRHSGYCEATGEAIEPLLTGLCDTELKSQLADELITQVKNECSKVAPGCQVPGSTEILESSFGKLKSIERSQSKSGFSSLLLVWAALFGTTTMETIRAATSTVAWKHVKTWIKKQLGDTVQSKRTRMAHILRAKLTGKPEDT